MKIVTIVGARPQFIKSSVVSRAFARSGCVRECVVHTGQHFDANMSAVFFDELGIPAPSYFLGINGGTHGEMTARMIVAVERVLLEEKPTAALVYGDTNSTLAGALAAAKLNIPVAHVEAGLRSFNMLMPEEVNRRLTDHVSNWLYTPTKVAVRNLAAEGIAGGRVVPVGDVMYDAALHFGARVSASGGVLEREQLSPKSYVLVTIHRAENVGSTDRLCVLADAFEAIARDVTVVWPIHPRTRDALNALGRLDRLRERVCLIDPVGYLDMVQLEKHAALIATDSGGVQKEAFFFRVPCVTLRTETEWVELVDSGWNELVTPDSVSAVRDAIIRRLGTEGREVSPYGDGTAAEAISSHLQSGIT